MVDVVIPKAYADVETNKQILEFISQFEWLHLVAYWDYKQWSIWHWVKSFKWEVITQEEAEIRARIRIQEIKDRYKLWNYSIEVQQAVVSYVYNLWSLSISQQWKLNNNYFCALWNDFKQYVYAWWNKLGWLVKRRQAEYNKLCN